MLKNFLDLEEAFEEARPGISNVEITTCNSFTISFRDLLDLVSTYRSERERIVVRGGVAHEAKRSHPNVSHEKDCKRSS